MQKSLIQIKDQSVWFVIGFSEIGRGACGKGFHERIVPIDKMFVVIEIDGIQFEQLVEGPVDADLSFIELIDKYFDLFIELYIIFEQIV